MQIIYLNINYFDMVILSNIFSLLQFYYVYIAFHNQHLLKCIETYFIQGQQFYLNINKNLCVAMCTRNVQLAHGSHCSLSMTEKSCARCTRRLRSPTGGLLVYNCINNLIYLTPVFIIESHSLKYFALVRVCAYT